MVNIAIIVNKKFNIAPAKAIVRLFYGLTLLLKRMPTRGIILIKTVNAYI